MIWRAKIADYKKDSIKFILAFSLAAVWVLVSSLFVSKAALFQNSSTAHASDNRAAYVSVGSRVKVGPATQELISKIEETGLAPIAVSKNTRGFFSVEGKIITLGKDNITVFEYEDSVTAMSEVSSFQKSAGTSFGSWKKGVHLYTAGNLTVFYMGERKSIIDSLDSIFGQSVPL